VVSEIILNTGSTSVLFGVGGIFNGDIRNGT
jgi:hypothetical protein